MIAITENADLTARNTMRMNVSARRLISFTEASDLDRVMEMVRGCRYIIMGQGSNLLFTADFDGTVIVPDIDFVSFSADGSVTAGAGVVMDSLIEEACRRNLWGIENLSGIPGTVGASAVQNVGAYGVEAGDLVQQVSAYELSTGRTVTLSRHDCRFAYRDSMFKHHPELLITSVTYGLSVTPRPRLDYGNLRSVLDADSSLTPMEVRRAVIAVRNAKLPDPAVTGSAGSFFKNPVISPSEFERLKSIAGMPSVPHFLQPDGVKIPAAWLIENAGFKGFSLGNAATWHLQPLVIVNLTGRATPDEIIALENLITAGVREKFNITLTPEVQHI